jgi:hypothetical protein
MTSLKCLLVEAYNRPDPNPFLYEVGQTVRLLLGRSRDGQTPECWNGAKCVVVSRVASGLSKQHWYAIRHPCGAVDEFREEEIDARYIRKPKK